MRIRTQRSVSVRKVLRTVAEAASLTSQAMLNKGVRVNG